VIFICKLKRCRNAKLQITGELLYVFLRIRKDGTRRDGNGKEGRGTIVRDGGRKKGPIPILGTKRYVEMGTRIDGTSRHENEEAYLKFSPFGDGAAHFIL